MRALVDLDRIGKAMGLAMSDRFAEWEIEVLDALAQESLERLQEKEWVKFPERFKEKCIADLQREMREHPKERSSLMAHARRLNVGPGKLRHPPRLAALGLDDYEPASPETAQAHIAGIMDRLRPSPLAAALERTKERA